jgi:hypothetical protein
MKLGFSRQIFVKKNQILIFIKIRLVTEPSCSIWTDKLTDRQTDMSKLVVAFRNFANAPKNKFNMEPLYLNICNSLRNLLICQFP